MKINKKIIVSSLAICMGAAIAGSVSGTVAWYQYSTRSQASMAAVTAGANKNLQISLTGDDDDWHSDLSTSDLEDWLEGTSNDHSDGTALEPLTSGAMTSTAALGTLYKNPIYQFASESQWGEAEDTDFIQIPLHVRYVEDDGSGTPTYPSKDIYLQDLTIVGKDVTSSQPDISDAVRVHLAGSTNVLCANVASTTTNGELDLNGDGVSDKEAAYDFEDEPDTITYGTGSQSSVDVSASSVSIFADDSDPSAFDATGAFKVGTSATSAGCLCTMSIWLEGWQTLGSPASAIWDLDYVGSAFNVGIRFCCDPQPAGTI